MEKLAEDIVAKIRRDFPESDAPSILEMLSEVESEKHFGERILRCIVFDAEGSFEKFARAVEVARVDWRDLISHVEYDGSLRARDFNKPFPLAPENKASNKQQA